MNFEQTTANSLQKREEVLQLLNQYKISTDSWGKDEARQLEHLVNEILSGEAILVEDENGDLVREVLGSGIDVFYKDETGTYHLIEDKQEYLDGRTRKRTADLQRSIGEKHKLNEDPLTAAKRALQEELGLDPEKVKLTQSPDYIKGPVPSKAFPGLKTKYITNVFEAYLDKEQYNPDGYIERQPDKTTFFIWEKVE